MTLHQIWAKPGPGTSAVKLNCEVDGIPKVLIYSSWIFIPKCWRPRCERETWTFRWTGREGLICGILGLGTGIELIIQWTFIVQPYRKSTGMKLNEAMPWIIELTLSIHDEMICFRHWQFFVLPRTVTIELFIVPWIRELYSRCVLCVLQTELCFDSGMLEFRLTVRTPKEGLQNFTQLTYLWG